MDRLIRFNVIATSGRAVEAAGDVDTLLLDKTGTITFGNRMATEFIPVPGVSKDKLAAAALASSLSDDTPEGRSIVALAKGDYGLAEPKFDPAQTTVVPFAAQTRISGIDFGGRSIRKGAIDSILRYLKATLDKTQPEFRQAVERIGLSGGTPLAVTDDGKLLGVVELKDVVKPGIKERFAALRAMGIRTVMVTGDQRPGAVGNVGISIAGYRSSRTGLCCTCAGTRPMPIAGGPVADYPAKPSGKPRRQLGPLLTGEAYLRTRRGSRGVMICPLRPTPTWIASPWGARMSALYPLVRAPSVAAR
jgi:magnesium-transporting ATPase (P-type)